MFFLFDLPAIICDVIYDLEQKGVVNHIRKWIRFNRQSNQSSPIKSPITEHDGVLPVKKRYLDCHKKEVWEQHDQIPAKGFWVDKLSIYKIRFLLVISVLWKSYFFPQKIKVMMHRRLVYIEKSCLEEKKEDVILNMASPTSQFKLFYQTNLYDFFHNDITEIIIHI